MRKSLSSSSKDRPCGIEIQKGPISMDDQYNIGFCREPYRTMQDMENLKMRREGMTLTKHEPKR
jgi:hypothetical protein